MSHLSQTCAQWRHDADVIAPRGVTISPVDVHSGQALARRTGITHYVKDAAEISDDTDTFLVAVWLCGGSSVDAVAMDEPDAHPDCASCQLAAALPTGPVVYYAWGDGDELLYIGSTKNAPQRIRSHMSQSAWWGEVKRLTFTQHEREIDARRDESKAIREKPGTHNRGGRSKPKVKRLLAGIEIVA